MALPPGAQLGPYRIVDKVGEGGMGEVYRAHDARLHRDVAVKILPSAFASDPDRLRRFEQEARAAAALNHPNVLAVYDVHIQGDPPYLVSELLEGVTLRERLTSGPLPPRTAVDIATQIARGLAAAHQKGIVHRDLKPANVFITSDGRAKILDFGLARVVDPRPADDVVTISGGGPSTGVGDVLGTVGYMSPEQARGEPADTRSDIFAVGVICYEMLAGRRAFGGASEVEVLSAILRDDPPDLPADAVPEALDRFVRRCLEKQPAQRFQSASDVAFAFEALSGNSARAGERTPLPMTRPARRPSAVLVAAALAAAVVAAGAVAWRLAAPAESPVVTYDPKTFDRLPIMNARFMPDGQTIVYSAATRGYAPELFVVSPTAEAPQPLGVADAHLLSVSRTGELALVVNARHEQQRLYGGTFARMTIGSAPRAVRNGVREADWQPNGESLAIVQDLGTGRDRLEYPAGRGVRPRGPRGGVEPRQRGGVRAARVERARRDRSRAAGKRRPHHRRHPQTRRPGRPGQPARGRLAGRRPVVRLHLHDRAVGAVRGHRRQTVTPRVPGRAGGTLKARATGSAAGHPPGTRSGRT